MNYNPAPLWARIFHIFIIKPKWTLIILIISGAIIAKCTEKKIDPIDNHYLKAKHWLMSVYVTDSTFSGFDVHIETTDYVTQKRADEILSRDHISKRLEELKTDALDHFNYNLMFVDIYDFAEFALNYINDKEVNIKRILVAGKRCRAYIGPHPQIKNSATWYNPNTQQGILYIESNDIYYYRDKDNRKYRYWKCHGPFATSSVEERFSHFSEDDRLQH